MAAFPGSFRADDATLMRSVDARANAPVLKADGGVHHLAIIMDGNQRWARARGLPAHAGHRSGARNIRPVAEAAADRGVEALTLFAFSTENWRRPRTEVRFLMELLRRVLANDVRELHANNVRLSVVGERAAFSADIRRLMDEAEQLTVDNTGLQLYMATNYGGRWDIARAARALAQQVAAGELAPEDISEARFAAQLSLSSVPAPDLLVRTGGDRRISNFLLWEAAYTELYFSDLFWPDFDAVALDAALADFASRNRNYGGR